MTFSTSVRPGMTLPVSLHFAKADAKADVYISIRNGSNHSLIFAEADPLSVNGGGERPSGALWRLLKWWEVAVMMVGLW